LCKKKLSISRKELSRIANKLQVNNKNGNTIDFIENTTLENSRKICDAGKLYLMIVTGLVYACPFMPQKHHMDFNLGSIYESKLSEIIKGKQNINFSDKCLGCHATCTTEISRIFRFSPIKLAKDFFHLKKIYKI
jgi:hypothetical protein